MPIHPVIVHFPIVLSCVLVLFEFFPDISDSLKKKFSLLFVVALLASFFTGVSDSNNLNELSAPAEYLVSQHYTYGRIALFLGIPLPLLLIAKEKFAEQRKLLQRTYQAILLLTLLCTLFSGYLGGQIVHLHGITQSALQS